ncbi:MAG TPA: alkaline phosphatase family protein [Trebonia sp.]
MPDITRRRFLASAEAVAVAALGAEALPKNVRKALAAGPPKRPGRLSDIKHVVILMQENRGFNHYFGTLPNVRGFSDPTALTLTSGLSVFHQPTPTSLPAPHNYYNPDGYLLPFHIDTKTTAAQMAPSLGHDWVSQHSAWNNGAMDSFVATNGPYSVCYYERDDIPFHFALAENFTICDNYHCSAMSETWPNRLYAMSATIDPSGENGGPAWSNSTPVPSGYGWKTYPEALTDAGVSWQVYQEVDNGQQYNMLEEFATFQAATPSSTLFKSGLRTFGTGQFEFDAANDRLPTVSWIMPTSHQSEHPDYTPAAGADYIASKIDAIASNPDVWAKTAFILTYDENDGHMDHVPPPTPPAGTPDEFVQVAGHPNWPIGAGFRVPCLIVSPWTQGGWVASETFDHTSLLRFLEVLTGVTIPNITPWRRATFGDLTSAFGMPQFPSAVRRLPNTEPMVTAAVEQVTTLPFPPTPGPAGTYPSPNNNQVMPVQEQGPRPRPRVASAEGNTANVL